MGGRLDMDIFKGDCLGCGREVVVESSEVGETVVCPHCSCRLFVAVCPDCACVFIATKDPVIGEILVCSDCAMELEIRESRKVVLKVISVPEGFDRGNIDLSRTLCVVPAPETKEDFGE